MKTLREFRKNMWAKTIFKNPVGWAGNLVGTQVQYLIISGLSLFFGILVTIVLAVESEGAGELFLKTFLSFVMFIELPQYYLRALRAMVRKLNGPSRSV